MKYEENEDWKEDYDDGYNRGKTIFRTHNDPRSCLESTIKDFLYCYKPGSGPAGYVPSKWMLGHMTAVAERCSKKYKNIEGLSELKERLGIS
jgi:hypothetical protein